MTSSALLKQQIDKTYPTATHGHGIYLFDQHGKRYLDGCCGAMTASLGHGNKTIARAMQEQAEKVAFTYRTQFTNQPAEELAWRLVELAPGDLSYAFFVNSGSEASEFAIRTAVNHFKNLGKTEKIKVLGRHSSYHGMTMGAMSLSGHSSRRKDYGPLLHPFPVAPPAYAYRHARPEESELEYAARSAAEFEAAILAEGPKSVAAIIVEPIVGAAGGVLVPPPTYLARLREICDRLEILLIFDEVITGMGRTGNWFVSAEEGVVPDILLMGKGLSAGYAPVGAILLRDHLVQSIRQTTGTASFGHTFSGNPLAMATCLAVLDLMESSQILDNVCDRGQQLKAGLRKLSTRYTVMGDVRGRGLLWGFEFVTDPILKTAPHPSLRTSDAFVEACLEQGLMVYPAGIAPLNNAAIICPPLNITEEEVKELLQLLEPAVAKIQQQVLENDTEIYDKKSPA